jgi:iron complex transport system ATP-binding protein
MNGAGIAITVADLALAYGRREILSDVALDVAAGERLCLVGPNGAGKSSLLRCLTGLAAPTRGRVSLDGVPLAEIDRATLARRISVVPSQVELPFALRVEELVGLGRLPYERLFGGGAATDRAAVDVAIARVGIERLRGRDVRELSMGERQLVLVAMALAQGGRLLVLDEPTVHLDLRHQVEVLSLLARLSAEGVTVIAVLHDLPLAAHFFERLVLLDQGRVVADGRAGEVLSAERIHDVYGVDPRFVPALGQVASP